MHAMKPTGSARRSFGNTAARNYNKEHLDNENPKAWHSIPQDAPRAGYIPRKGRSATVNKKAKAHNDLQRSDWMTLTNLQKERRLRDIGDKKLLAYKARRDTIDT